MNATWFTPWRRASLLALVGATCVIVSLSACSHASQETPLTAHVSPASETAEGVVLTVEEVKNLGIETSIAAADSRLPEAAGFAVVLAHDAVAQSVAELSSALAVQRQSEAALERSRRLAGTTGAMAVDVQEAAERQAMVDRAALELARRRASSVWGQNPPWGHRGVDADVSAVARGDAKIIRVTFPIGAVGDVVPKTVRVARIATDPAHAGWQSATVWAAPADATVPGTSFFALLKGSPVSEGERLAAWAPIGAAATGVMIPTSAVIISNGQYGFFVETKPNVFLRTALDTSMPVADGYFVRQGIAAGAKIVTTSAGLLLARETNPSPGEE